MSLRSLWKKLRKQKQRTPASTPPRSFQVTLSYPWSSRPLDRPGSLISDLPHPLPPFPRYGLAITQTTDPKGDLYFVGGLAEDAEDCHLYKITTVDDTTSFVQTSGDVPSPRLGHTVALLRNVVILWGGDTNRNTSPNHDNSLYLLNLLTREWTLLKVSSPAPRGRYGHTLTLIGSKLYVFGGQVNQEFFNDIWLFDLNSLKTMPTWDHSHEPATSVRPPPRTTHSSVAFEDQIIIFGGTDGKYHYNDTWSFNVNTRVWTELICAGYIPAPRESHAAAVVDGIMYVFGGRGVDSLEIGQLAALNLHTRRWYTFQNMGPEPCPRSGHRMAVVDRLIYILGGDAVNKKPSDDFISAYVLDTKLLKYPNT